MQEGVGRGLGVQTVDAVQYNVPPEACGRAFGALRVRGTAEALQRRGGGGGGGSSEPPFGRERGVWGKGLR